MVVCIAGLLACLSGRPRRVRSVTVPPPMLDAPRAAAAGQRTAVISGGCFWGVQAVFQHVKGVVSATSGYAGGSANTAEYETVSTGETGHAESVQIVYDPSQVTYSRFLLRVFFSVALTQTQLPRQQGPDQGAQYRSSDFFSNDEQKLSPRHTSRNSTRPEYFRVRS